MGQFLVAGTDMAASCIAGVFERVDLIRLRKAACFPGHCCKDAGFVSHSAATS